MRVVIHKNGMLEMSIINVIFLTNVEKCFRVVIYLLLLCIPQWAISNEGLCWFRIL